MDNREIPSIKINESQIALLLIDAVGNEITEHDRYFNFMVNFWKVEIPSDYSQNITDYKQNYLPRNIITDLPLRNCSSLNYSKFSSFYETFSKVYFSGVCIDSSNMTDPLFGKYGGVEGYSFLVIYIRKCQNSTINNKTNCFPEDVIDKKLSQVFLNLVGIEDDVDSNNFTNPTSEYYKNEILPLSSTVFKNYYKDINSVKFRTDNGFLSKNEQTSQSYRTDRIVESVDLRGKNTLFPGTFSQITFRCSGKTENFYRSYLKVHATVAYIGGIIQVIILVGKSIVYIYSKNSLLNYLIYHIFDMEEVNNVLKNDQRSLVNNRISPMNFTDSNLPFNNNIIKQKIIPVSSFKKLFKSKNSIRKNNIIQDFPSEIKLENVQMNLITDTKDKIKTKSNEELYQIDKYFYSAIKENRNFINRTIQESRAYEDNERQNNKDIKRLGDYAANNINKNNEMGNNMNINFASRQRISNNRISDPNFHLNNKKEQ